MSAPIRIAVASGKGGTGKTTIATNLAVTLAEAGERVAYVDCDVEEPNGHLFLAPTIRTSRPISIPVPEVDESRCTYCGACGKACRYSAILVLPKAILTFPKLCHGCGGCSLACTAGAIREVPRPIGVVEEGVARGLAFLQGRMDVGEAMSPPLIRAVLGAAPRDRITVLDAPPGTSCPVIESVKTADAVLLVTEPTPFGLNDLKLAVGMVRELGLPFGVAVNRAGIGDDAVYAYCAEEGIPVLLDLPNDREIASAYSRGILAVEALPRLRTLFSGLFEKLVAVSRERPQPRPGAASRPRSEVGASSPPPSGLLPAGETAGPPELVVVSGKGGTGKTSIVASFAALAGRSALADCDVDAADLHLVLRPTVRERRPFSGGKTAVVDTARCTGCGVCASLCRFDAVHPGEGGEAAVHEVDGIGCEGCGVCADHCPEGAIEMTSSPNGEWYVSGTRHGPMAHARLGIAQENSGKLVALVRLEGRALAILEERESLICDGSPGIGCPVIASITGARFALVVTEPTVSGLHDLERIAELTRQLGVNAGVCINKADINPEIAARIERGAAALGIAVLGRIRYDDAVTRAQVEGVAVVEAGDGPAAQDVRALWARVVDAIG